MPPRSLLMDTATRDQHRRAIDEKIKMLEGSILESKCHRNELAPISTLPSETLAMIFSFLSPSRSGDKKAGYLAWLHVTHVCRRWRDIALEHPCLWGYINFNNLTLAGIAETLARAKMTPLHLEAAVADWSKARFDALKRQLEAHISHTRHLDLSGQFPKVLERILSSAPALECLSLSSTHVRFQSSEPPSLPKIIAPKLTTLELIACNISWKTLLFKGLQTLKIVEPSGEARPTLEVWLDALDAMPQLESLTLEDASPIVPVGNWLISEPCRTVILPSLTRFNITASAKECTLSLTHLVLPALTSLHVHVSSDHPGGKDVRVLIPHVARNAHGPQDTAPLQRISINVNTAYAEIQACTLPDVDNDSESGLMPNDYKPSTRMVFSAVIDSWWRDGTDTKILDTMLTHLPIDAISTLSAWEYTQLSKQFWLRHGPRLAMLKHVYLSSTALRGFRQNLVENTPYNSSPRLSQLTKLTLHSVALTTLRTSDLLCMLMKRMEQGVPLEALDLRTCCVAKLAIQMLAMTVHNVQGPEETLSMGDLGTFTDDDDIPDGQYNVSSNENNDDTTDDV